MSEFAQGSAPKPAEPPADLPPAPAAFLAMPLDVRTVEPPVGVMSASRVTSAAAPVESALKRLGPLPFPRGAVPLMGLFASLFDHVSEAALRFASDPAEQADR